MVTLKTLLIFLEGCRKFTAPFGAGLHFNEFVQSEHQVCVRAFAFLDLNFGVHYIQNTKLDFVKGVGVKKGF